MKTAKVAPPARAKRSTAKRRKARALRLTIQNATTSASVPSARLFRKWVQAALRGDASVTLRVVGLNEARELNRAYRGKDYATNVLTFVMRDGAPFEGDIALCAPVVSREARSQQKRSLLPSLFRCKRLRPAECQRCQCLGRRVERDQ